MKQYEKVVEIQNDETSIIKANVLYVFEDDALISLTQDRKQETRFDHIILNKEQIKKLYELTLGK